MLNNLSHSSLESGDVYAIDVGGTNFRVMYVHLSEEESKVVSHAMQRLGETATTGWDSNDWMGSNDWVGKQ